MQLSTLYFVDSLCLLPAAAFSLLSVRVMNDVCVKRYATTATETNHKRTTTVPFPLSLKGLASTFSRTVSLSLSQTLSHSIFHRYFSLLLHYSYIWKLLTWERGRSSPKRKPTLSSLPLFLFLYLLHPLR